ncbi:MAG TPA: dTDP-4-dehydrorhamnose 3,5-epimerase [Steroidobacteraceae bacterium]|jgi:dTDP-4-dehydrorhamnose 3,5-epimerase|nr:dTDP-4-dehydrorhamnose 3,5-epimerase [Steroidobacteraceae bacterium]
MRAVPLALPGLVLIEHRRFEDPRGAFFESWNERAFAAAGIAARFVQENVSVSAALVLRGLHYQIPHAQGKLVRVLAGEIFDVVVDLRRASPAFGRSLAVSLDATHAQSLWVPPGFAHGFLALAPDTRVQYKVTDFWSRESEHTLAWNDPALGIRWPIPEGGAPLLSDKDREGALLAQAETFP